MTVIRVKLSQTACARVRVDPGRLAVSPSMRRLQSRTVLPAAAVAAALSPKHLGAARRWLSSSPVNPAAFAAAAKADTGNLAADNVESVLPGVDLAKRVASPDQVFPATWSSDEPLAPDDPRIVWKEHYSLAESRPYYHNVNTNETTTDIPEGFVTRFPQLYRKSGYVVDSNGAVHRSGEAGASGSPGEPSATGGATAAEGEAAASPAGKKLTAKQKLAAYGGGGLLWYLIVHNVVLATIFSLLYFFKVDLIALAKSYGFNVKVKRSEEVEEISRHSNRHPPFFKTLLLAIVLNKLLVPVQLVFTLATAPFLVHRLEPIAVVLLPKCRTFFHNLKLKITGAAPS